jgi:acetyltransferase EpsM
VVVWGASGHALVVADVLRAGDEYEIVGFLDDVSPERRQEAFGGATVLGGREQLDDLQRRGVAHAIVAFGDCGARLVAADHLLARGFRLARGVHPRATVARDVAVGGGTVVCAGAVVGPGAALGANVIVNTLAGVDHECVVEDGAHVGPGVRLGGRVRVGRGTWVGIGATVIDRVTLGAGSIVGAGAVVLDDVPDGVVAYGVPARVRRRVAGDGPD